MEKKLQELYRAVIEGERISARAKVLESHSSPVRSQANPGRNDPGHARGRASLLKKANTLSRRC